MHEKIGTKIFQRLILFFHALMDNLKSLVFKLCCGIYIISYYIYSVNRLPIFSSDFLGFSNIKFPFLDIILFSQIWR